MVRQEHEPAHDGEAYRPRRELRRRDQCEPVTDEPDEWERAHPAEGIARPALLVLFALEPNE